MIHRTDPPMFWFDDETYELYLPDNYGNLVRISSKFWYDYETVIFYLYGNH